MVKSNKDVITTFHCSKWWVGGPQFVVLLNFKSLELLMSEFSVVLDSNEPSIDFLVRRLQVLEQEVAQLRNRVQQLEAGNNGQNERGN